MPDTAPIYNLKAVILETGLSPETLRAWERRYGLLKPQRSPGGHRLYSQYDIEMLQWLVARQKEGLSISHAVEMWRKIEKDGQDPLQPYQSAQIQIASGESILDDLRLRWVEACMAFDEQVAEQALSQAFAIATPEVVCMEVLQKGLADVGQRWQVGNLSVQQEHFASGMALRRLDGLFSAAPPPTRSERILAACPSGDEHSFSLLLVSYLLRRRGWDVVYLGANVPVSRLESTLKLVKPSLVLSVAQTMNSVVSLREMAQVLNAERIPMAYGGWIFTRYPAMTHCVAAHYLGSDLTAVSQGIERLVRMSELQPVECPIPPEFTQALMHFNAHELQIAASVVDAMRVVPVPAVRIEYVQYHLTRDINAALSLGDIHYVQGSLEWLDRQLEDFGLTDDQRRLYINLNRQSIRLHLGQDEAHARSAALILEGFAGF